MPKGLVSFERKLLTLSQSANVVSYPDAAFWKESTIPLCSFEVKFEVCVAGMDQLAFISLSCHCENVPSQLRRKKEVFSEVNFVNFWGFLSHLFHGRVYVLEMLIYKLLYCFYIF